MYKRIPLQIAFVAFPNPDTAAFTAGDLALTLLERDISCSNILIITKNTNCQVDISEFGKNGPLKGLIAGSYGGTIVGASIGGIALSLLGPFGIAIGGGLGALAGATVGAVGGTIGGTAKALMARSVDKKRIQSFASCLEPESSALVAIFGEVVIKHSELHEKDFSVDLKGGIDEVASVAAETIRSSLKKKQVVGFGLAVEGEAALMTPATVSDKNIDIGAFMLTPHGAWLLEQD